MINLIICFHTQWEVFFQIKFHPGMKFYSFHPGMKLTCKQKFFHPGTSFIPGWDFVSVTCKRTLKRIIRRITGRGRRSSYSSPSLSPTHDYWDMYWRLYICRCHFAFLIVVHIIQTVTHCDAFSFGNQPWLNVDNNWIYFSLINRGVTKWVHAKKNLEFLFNLF